MNMYVPWLNIYIEFEAVLIEHFVSSVEVQVQHSFHFVCVCVFDCIQKITYYLDIEHADPCLCKI